MEKTSTATAVVNFNPIKELNAPEDEATKMKALFQPMLDRMEELEEEYNSLIESIEGDPTKIQCDQAKALGKKFQKARIGTADIHKKAKAHHLLMSRVADGWKNAQKLAGGEKEDKLKEIAQHYELKEAQRIENLRAERAAILAEYGGSGTTMDLGNMSLEVWNHVLEGTKKEFAIKKEAEEKAEKDRQEQERKKELYQSRREILLKYAPYSNLDQLTEDTTEDQFKAIAQMSKTEFDNEEKRKAELKAENEKLKAERAAEEKAERERNEKINTRLALFKSITWNGTVGSYKGQIIFGVADLLRSTDAQLKKIYDKHNKQVLKDEKVAQEAAQALEAQKAKEKAEEERKSALKAAKDKEKLELWLKDFLPEGLPILRLTGMKSESKEAYKDIQDKFTGFRKWAEKTIADLK